MTGAEASLISPLFLLFSSHHSTYALIHRLGLLNTRLPLHIISNARLVSQLLLLTCFSVSFIIMTNPGYPSHPVRSKIYISHFLSTWNSRLFEFGAVLFISTIFPGTLLPASIYALTRSASVVVFSTAIGHLIDCSERIFLIRLSISKYLVFSISSAFFHLTVLVCCSFWSWTVSSYRF